MAAHRPIAHRTFAVIIAALLVGSMLAPIAATAPAAAQNSDDSIEFSENCGSLTRLVAPQTCQAAALAFGSIDDGQTASAIEQDIHVGATGVKSTQDASVV